MFDFGFVNVLPPIVALAINEAVNFFKKRHNKKRAEKMGEIIDSINTMSFNPENKYLVYSLGAIGVLFGAAGIIGGIMTYDFYIASKGLSYGLLLIFLPSRWKKSSSVFICKNGIYTEEFQITFDELDRIEWDRDINQKQWGLRIHKKNQTPYYKIYINRKLKDEFNIKLMQIINASQQLNP